MSKLARYVEARNTKGGVAYYFCPPSRYVHAGIIRREALGTDQAKALERAAVLNAELDRRLKGDESAQPVQEAVERGTVNDLRDRYQRSMFFVRLADDTKTNYRKWLHYALRMEVDGRPFGSYPAADVTPNLADQLVSALHAAHGPHLTAGAVRVLNKVFQLGWEWDFCNGNPFGKVRLPYLGHRKQRWQPEHVEQFCAMAEKMGQPEVGDVIRLAYETAQRPRDIFNLTKGAFIPNTNREKDDPILGFVELEQNKTKSEVCIPILDPRVAAMFEGNPDDLVVTNPTTGEKWNSITFNHRMTPIRRAAGIPNELQLRDLRRTKITELAEAGATEDELRSISGHKSRQVLSVYVRPTRRQALNAMRKWNSVFRQGGR